MPTLKVNDKTAEVETGQRLVLAIMAAGVEIGHRCGGKARCTTCRVVFRSGEPDTMTEAEHAKLLEKGLLGEYRLSCQILCEGDMEVVPQMTLANQNWSDTGPQPQETVEPEAKWYPKGELMAWQS